MALVNNVYWRSQVRVTRLNEVHRIDQSCVGKRNGVKLVFWHLAAAVKRVHFCNVATCWQTWVLASGEKQASCRKRPKMDNMDLIERRTRYVLYFTLCTFLTHFNVCFIVKRKFESWLNIRWNMAFVLHPTSWWSSALQWDNYEAFFFHAQPAGSELRCVWTVQELLSGAPSISSASSAALALYSP